MATLKQPKDEAEIRRLGVNNVRQAYLDLAGDYNRIINNDVMLCPKCGKWQKSDTSFYFDKKYVTNRLPICKRCIQMMVEQREKDTDEPNETKESVQKVLQYMDRVYDNNFYEQCVKGAADGLKEKNRVSPFATYITAVQSLPNWKGMTWKDSKFGDDGESIEESEINENSRILKTARKRFGSDYSSQDLLFLEREYQDWISRYACETKAQELLFQRIAFTQLAIDKAQKSGQDTDKLDKTLQDLMSSNSIKPNQSTSNALTESKTFGQLIQKWEEHDPIPEPEEEFKDVDKIGLYIDVFFKGHLAKMMNLKNAFSTLYEKYIAKYTVKKPQYDEDTDSEELFDQIFGSVDENKL